MSRGTAERIQLKRSQRLQHQWTTSPRWEGTRRDHSAFDVARLQGPDPLVHVTAKLGAERLWLLLNSGGYINTLGALTGTQACQMVEAGLQAIYVSGWQAAADNNTADTMYPDRAIYPCDSVPTLVERINRALRRQDEKQWAAGISPGDEGIRYTVPLVADADAGFGSRLSAWELTKRMIEAGAAGIHLEDQDAAHKKCGHLGGKVLIPTSKAIDNLKAARFAADICDVPLVLIARTDAESATHIQSDVDPYDHAFIDMASRNKDGFYRIRNGFDLAVHRALAYAPYADVIWCETSTPDLEFAKAFAEAIHAAFPGMLLAYNCSPSFNWSRISREERERFQRELGKYGYVFQFVTLAGIHAMWLKTHEVVQAYLESGMQGYYERVQKPELEAAEQSGYPGVKHQTFVGTGYVDEVERAMAGDEALSALDGSTESQFASN